jgi:gliding motility-associated-like protein
MLTDSCYNFTTKYGIIVKDGTSYIKNGYSSFQFIGCDTLSISYNYILQNSILLHSYLKTKYGVQTSTNAYQNFIVPNLTYGDTVEFKGINSCNDSVSSRMIIGGTNLSIYNNIVLNSCSYTNYFGIGFSGTSPKGPIYNQYTIRRNHSSIIINDSVNQQFQANFGDSIFVISKDGCGRIYYDSVHIPLQGLPAAGVSIYSRSCLDSTALCRFTFGNFGKGISFKITSGPAVAKSTKPKFSYLDSVVYNNTYYLTSNMNYFDLEGFPPGLYTYYVSDSCGHSISSSFQVFPWQVADLSPIKMYYTLGCIGQNVIYWTYPKYPSNFTFSTLSIKDLNKNLVVANVNLVGFSSLQNFYSGMYQLKFDYNNYSYKVTKSQLCNVVYDTLSIPPYYPPKISNYGTFYCNGNWYVDLTPDSSYGIPPFNYEVISGPTTCPLQPSSTIQFTKPGVYLARIVDACGSGSTYNFTADTTLKFAILQNGNLCGGGRVVFKCHSSPYFTYHWKYNNTLINIGDSLVFNPFNISSDTGNYKITKYVNFNGCHDSITVDLFLRSYSTSTVNYMICQGDSLLWRNKYFSYSTFASDTILNSNNCDSILYLNLIVKPKTYGFLNVKICQGSIYQTPSGKVLSNLGLYFDTIPNYLYCDSIITIQLDTFHKSFGFINISICKGNTYQTPSGKIISSAGLYFDTIPDFHFCDSIIRIQLGNINFTTGLINTAICQGTTYQTPSGKILLSGGLYYDTIPNSKGCDSIITIQLYIKNNSGSSVNSTICQNQNYILPSGNTVNQSGIYIDTLTNYNGCDSIVKTYLTVLKMNRDTVYASICDNVLYQLPNGSSTNVAGIYTDSFINYIGCDSIIITHLNVLQNPSITFPNFVPICLGNTITLNAFVPNATYQWNDLSTNSNHSFTNTGNYWVIISNPPCKADTANVSLNFIDCTCRMIAPNAFTPNDDGMDDLFKPMSTCDLNIFNYHLKIYNRLGQVVFSTDDLNASWNGTYKSLPQEVSTYSYIIEWTNPTTNQIEITKGNLNLIR